ncbi:hypothetical protein B0H67DRAFT_649376 [Lasiosphaeris hirsuta]|uniref:CID domain-containing protein n=1 Tax=Lasiosphaeris hirsuta TaxID=260670 RepID=A0AA39ZWJ7_9PEZI|nr:hypothetical protein B0H67DRAFT_649376 [Lasiosphaeris hirsuta]
MADNGADVADDYRQALEDLTMNSRIEIATLTNIARENANHGLAITEVLQNHIKKVPPPRTLPALYVLDSVVKNVPTPYALYFGPKLYSIFMNAYTKVDNTTRRKMEEMLRTWKEPVPGSISTKPVFPPQFVQPIENALIAARNAAYQANQSSFRRPPQVAPARDTPTPPVGRPASHQAGPHGQQPFPGPPNGQQQTDPALAQQPYPMRPHNGPSTIAPRVAPQPYSGVTDMPHYQQPVSRENYGAPQPGISIDKLKDDIQQLIIAERTEFARNPLDASRQTRLKALLDLQAIIQRHDMPQDQLMLVKDRVTELAVNMRAPGAVAITAAPLMSSTYTPPPPPVVSQQPTPVPPVAIARPPSVTTGAAAVPPPAAGAGGFSIDALFGQGALAALLSAAPKPATPQQVPSASATPQLMPQPLPQALPASLGAALAAMRSPPPQRLATPPAPAPAPVAAPVTTPAPAPAPAAPTAALASNPSALLAMLRQSGLIQPTTSATATPPTTHASLPVIGGAQATAAPRYQPPLETPLSYQFRAAHLKQFRPSAMVRLEDDLGLPCTHCGRRFKTNEDGRRKKTAHMDWHFRVHQRIAEYEKRGQHRSFFVDELDWIKSLEAIDVDYVAPPAGGNNASNNDSGDSPRGASAQAGGKRGGGQQQLQQLLQYIAVPEDSSRVNTVCPICQERFEMKWLDEAQEWVWMDAVKIGERVFHASCHREATKDRDREDAQAAAAAAAAAASQVQQAYQRGVPEGVLGKRKAEDDFQSLRGKLKMEGY